MVRRYGRIRRRRTYIRRITLGKSNKNIAQGAKTTKALVYRMPIGMPQRYTCKLKYNTIISLNPGAGIFAVNSFRANSLFDPDLTGVGHQPTPFDQLATFYKKYFVRSAKYIMSPIRNYNDSAAQGITVFGMALQPVSGITTGLTWDDLMQSEKATQRIHYFMTTGSDSSPNGMTGPVKLYYSAKKYYGRGFDDDDYKALVTTNPALGPVVDAWAINPQGADVTATTYNIYIEFIATFSEPQTIGIS